jgi:hypothetical protein
MRIRTTPKVFSVINELKYKNLVVGGCSFTYNISDTDSSSWPYYTRDKCGFDQVYDCSIEGADNYQILTSVIYALEQQNLNPLDTLVIIMWSGYGRDSEIVHASNSKSGYNYTNQVVSINSTGQSRQKSKHSQALENYLYVTMLCNYLQNQKYQFVFLNFVDPKIPNRGSTFDITDFLPKKLKTSFLSMFTDIENFYSYCLKNELLQHDDFHPTMQGHLDWSHNILVPALTTNPNNATNN